MYTVTGLQLIPQTKTMACWYASAQMVVNWGRQRAGGTTLTTIDPSESSVTRALFTRDRGIKDAQILPVARDLGLRPVPPQCPTPDLVESWLRQYGPLWTNGRTHIVVLAGVDRRSQLLVYDPAPVNKGQIGWRSFWWYVGGKVDSRDPAASDAIFLHFPLQNV